MRSFWIKVGCKSNGWCPYKEKKIWRCLENPRDGGAWWAAVYGVAQSQTQLKRLSSSSSNRRRTEEGREMMEAVIASAKEYHGC